MLLYILSFFSFWFISVYCILKYAQPIIQLHFDAMDEKDFHEQFERQFSNSINKMENYDPYKVLLSNPDYRKELLKRGKKDS